MRFLIVLVVFFSIALRIYGVEVNLTSVSADVEAYSLHYECCPSVAPSLIRDCFIEGYAAPNLSLKGFKPIPEQELPSPHANLSVNLASFASRGFNERETVSLSGAHSIGITHCKISLHVPVNSIEGYDAAPNVLDDIKSFYPLETGRTFKPIAEQEFLVTSSTSRLISPFLTIFKHITTLIVGASAVGVVYVFIKIRNWMLRSLHEGMKELLRSSHEEMKDEMKKMMREQTNRVEERYRKLQQLLDEKAASMGLKLDDMDNTLRKASTKEDIRDLGDSLDAKSGHMSYMSTVLSSDSGIQQRKAIGESSSQSVVRRRYPIDVAGFGAL